MEEESWRRNHGLGGTPAQEAPRGTQEAPRRHPGGTQGTQEAPRRPEVSWRENVPKHMCFFSKSRATERFA